MKSSSKGRSNTLKKAKHKAKILKAIARVHGKLRKKRNGRLGF